MTIPQCWLHAKMQNCLQSVVLLPRASQLPRDGDHSSGNSLNGPIENRRELGNSGRGNTAKLCRNGGRESLCLAIKVSPQIFRNSSLAL